MIAGVLEVSLFHYAILPIVDLYLCRRWFGPFGRLSFPGCFTIAWLILVHAQAFEIYLNEYPLPLFLFSVWLTPLVVLVAAGPLAARLGHRVPSLSDARPREGGWRDAVLARLTPLATFGVVVLIAIYIKDIGVKNVALFFLFASPGSKLEGMLLRVSGLESNISPLLTIVYSYSRALLLPLYAATATSLWLLGRVSKWHWAIIVGASGLFSVLTAAKAPLAFTLAGVLLAAYLTRPGTVGIGKLAFFFAAAMFIPALIYPLITGATGLDALTFALQNLWRRTTYVTSVTGAMHFDAFPAVHDFVGFGSNRALGTIAGTPTLSTSEWVFDRYMAGTVHGGTVNTSFYASFYADWGMPGVILGAILVGVSLLGLQLFFDRTRPRDALTVACHATTLVAAMQLMMSNFFSVAAGRGMLTLPVLLWMVNVATARSRRREAPPVVESVQP